MQQKSGTKGPSSSGPSSSPTNTTQLIFPPFVQFQSNLRTLSLISGDVPPPSSAPSMVSEAAFISSYVVDTFTKLYSELLVYDPQESQLPIPAQLPYSLASFRVYTLVPFSSLASNTILSQYIFKVKTLRETCWLRLLWRLWYQASKKRALPYSQR